MLVDIESSGQVEAPEGRMMRCLCRLPELMQRIRTTRVEDETFPWLLDEVRAESQASLFLIAESRDRLHQLKTHMEDNAAQTPILVEAHACLQRSYGVCLALGIFMAHVLAAIDAEAATCTYTEMTRCSEDVLRLTKDVAAYKPLGSSYIQLCLCAAWMGTADPMLRSRIQSALADSTVSGTEDYRHELDAAGLKRMAERFHARLLPGQRTCD